MAAQKFRLWKISAIRTPISLVIASDYECSRPSAVTFVINRYYDPATGQFTSVDPDVALTGQPYAYVGDEPVNGADPTGLCILGGSWCNYAQHVIATSFDNFRHQSASVADFPGDIVVSAGTSIYNAYDSIYQAGVNGCSFFSLGTQEDVAGAVFADESAALLADGGGALAEAADDSLNLASEPATNHILSGDDGAEGHLSPGGAGKTPFPPSWSSGQIMSAISDIATSPSAWENAEIQGSRTVLVGESDGVEIRVVVDSQSGAIITGYPINLPRNP